MEIKTGLTTEIEVKYHALKNGIMVSTPFGDCSRYDQIWDVNGNLYKVQIKTASELKDGSGFRFPGKNKAGKYTSNQIDGIATIYNGKCYYIPIDKCGNEIKLRYTIPASSKAEDIKFAHDYELKRIFNI